VYVCAGNIFVYDSSGTQIDLIEVPERPTSLSSVAKTARPCSSPPATPSTRSAPDSKDNRLALWIGGKFWSILARAQCNFDWQWIKFWTTWLVRSPHFVHHHFCRTDGGPVPGVPFMVAAGVLAGAGKLNIALLLAVDDGCLHAGGQPSGFILDAARGNKVLKLLCRISLEPDSCVRRTEDVFTAVRYEGCAARQVCSRHRHRRPAVGRYFRGQLPRFLAYDGIASFSTRDAS